jgi:hypothetical protein
VVVGGNVVVVVEGATVVEIGVVVVTSPEEAGEHAVASSATAIAAMRIRFVPGIGQQATRINSTSGVVASAPAAEPSEGRAAVV